MIKLIQDSFKDKATVVKYALSGGTGVAANFAVFFLASEVFGVWYILGAILAFGAGVIVAFLLQKFWTFRHAEGNTGLQFASYGTVALINLAINLALLFILVQVFGVWDLIAQGVSLAVVALWSFLANRNFTFSKL